MRKFVSVAVLVGFGALPALAGVQSYKNVSLVDVNCSKKVAADPDSHTRECALKCQSSGYGIMLDSKEYVKFDAEGNAKIAQALKASNKKDHLRVDVTGDQEGDSLKVTSIKLL